MKIIRDALEYARMGLVPGGAYTNRDYLADKVHLDAGVEPAWADLLFTPETAGGLLMAVPETKTRMLEQAMQENSLCFFRIGCCGDRGSGSINVLP
jgi:selenide,water dikinase